MTDAVGHRAGAGDADGSRQPARAGLYRDGWVLVVHGPGLASRNVARQITEQCGQLNVDVVVEPITEVSYGRLYRYTTLFLVLEPPPDLTDTAVMEAFAVVFDTYRTLRPDGLDAVLSGKRAWQWAGPVHVLVWGPPDVTDHPALLAFATACVIRRVNDHRLLGNVFDMYDELPLTHGAIDDEVRLQEAIEHWNYLKCWNVAVLADVAPIRQIIERQAKVYSDHRFPKTSSPFPPLTDEGRQKYGKYLKYNRLELILHAPGVEYPRAAHRATRTDRHERDKINFVLSGAELVRKTLAVISCSYPSVRRPDEHKNTKGSQLEFHKFYSALLFIDTLPEQLGERIPDS